jgi:hypothetical protein
MAASSSWSWRARNNGAASEEEGEEEEEEKAIAVQPWTTTTYSKIIWILGVAMLRLNQREVLLPWTNSWGN